MCLVVFGLGETQRSAIFGQQLLHNRLSTLHPCKGTSQSLYYQVSTAMICSRLIIDNRLADLGIPQCHRLSLSWCARRSPFASPPCTVTCLQPKSWTQQTFSPVIKMHEHSCLSGSASQDRCTCGLVLPTVSKSRTGFCIDNAHAIKATRMIH